MIKIFFARSKTTNNEPVESWENQCMNGYSEWRYEMLINPVVNLLDPMEPKDKLIIVAPEARIFVYDNAKSWS
jgi:hypothetical protein